MRPALHEVFVTTDFRIAANPWSTDRWLRGSEGQFTKRFTVAADENELLKLGISCLPVAARGMLATVLFHSINRAADARKGRENRPQLRCGNESQPHIPVRVIGSKANLR
jgi:hypothetical protein